MIDEGLEVLKEIKDTPPEKRPWLMYVIFAIFVTGIALYFRSREMKALEEKSILETEIRILQSENLKENKDYNYSLSKAIKECDEKWQIKFENERAINHRYLEEKANKLESELNYLRTKSRRIESEAKSLKNKVNI